METETPPLHAVETGTDKAGGVPLLLLHGFASSHRYWLSVLRHLPDTPQWQGRLTLAFDLPGHGRSPPSATGRTAEAADILLDEMSRRGIARAHLAGHSMGGAIACLMALKAPDRVASLTLLAPGGFGREINADLLRRYAGATDAETLRTLLDGFYGGRLRVGRAALAEIVADRSRPDAAREYARIAETFLTGDSQGVLPIDDLAGLGLPVRVVWGDEDRIVPASQARDLDDRFAGAFDVHILAGVGHSLADEKPVTVAGLIAGNLDSA